MVDRLMIAAMAMQGLCADNTIAGRANKTFAEVVSSMALECSDALLAAAGEKEEPQREGGCACRGFYSSEMPTTVCGYHEELYAKLAACERERDAARAIVKSSQETTMAQEVRRRKDATKIAALRRMREQLTEDEAAEFAWRWELRPRSTVELVKEADRIRARRA